MGKDDDPYNPDKERPGYGISHPNYAAAHRHSYPGAPFEEPKVSDRRILAEVGKRLEAAGNLDLTLIRVDVSCGEATIDGGVTSEAEVALVEEIVCGVPGITACQNNLRVVDGE
ncbi:BON domain-containing protein [Parvibaculum sp.]|jgi:hypothetical protein|uniref:BON domain-containing protein n=1 Tax=Parvibaculum sp. TaxID=2024848 RepID=UPI002FDB4A5A